MENTEPLGGSPAEAAQPSVTVPTESAPVTEGADTPPVDAGIPERDKTQERINRLTAEKYEWARRYAELEARLQPKEPEPKPESKAPPTLAQFDYDEAKYQAALFEYTRAEARSAALEELKTARQREAAEAMVSSFKTREAEFVAKTPDYQEKVYDPSLAISRAMVELITESPEGPALAYHLASNPDQARQIASLPPLAAAREIGKIEAELSRPKPVSPPVSKAPAPPPKIEAVEPEVEKDPSNMTDKEFAKWRKRQIGQRRNR